MKRLAIIGGAPDPLKMEPFDDPDVDIWVFNESAMTTPEFYPHNPELQWCQRWDAVIQLHKPEVYQSPTNWVHNSHWEWLQRDHGPDKTIWMQEVDPLVPNSKKYPLDEIAESIPGGHRKWFASSPAYVIALAIYLGYKSIGCYGFDMGSNTEYGYQLMNFAYWIGICEGMGIDLYYQSNDKYFKSPLYGYEGELQLSKDYFQSRADMFAKELAQDRNKNRKLHDRLNEAILGFKFGKIPPIVVEMQNLSIKAGALSAAEKEARNYIKRDDMITRQEFERRGSQAQMDGESARALMYTKAGAAEYVFNAWTQTGQRQPLDQFRKFLDEQMKMAFNAGNSSGAFNENMEYCREYDKRVQAAGGPRTLIALKGGENGS